MPPDPAALAAAIHDYRTVEQKVRMCMAGPDALESARARLASFGDPAVILGETRPPTPTIECGSA